MNIFVVYDSVYGNTAIVARAIAEAVLGDTPVLNLEQVADHTLETAGLLIIGSPTHGAMPTDAMQKFLSRLGAPAREGARAATFDTRLTWPFLEKWGGFAADKMADTLGAGGWTVVGEPGGFYVRGLRKGPLRSGEAERAAAWARALVDSLS
jgi:flavodoxin